MACIGVLFRNYLDARTTYSSAFPNFDLREVGPYEHYSHTISIILLESFWNKKDFWKGYFAAAAMEKLDLREQKSHLSNDGSSMENPQDRGDSPNGPSKSPSESYVITEEDFPVLLNLAISEYALSQTPHCYPLKLLLGKAYFACGAASAGLDFLMKLDIKHMQIDSLGYLFMLKTLTSGSFSDSIRVLSHAESFYSNHAKEVITRFLYNLLV